MKKLITILTAIAIFFTVTNVIATVNVFSQNGSLSEQMMVERSTNDEAGLTEGCYLSSRNLATTDLSKCKGRTIEYPSKQTFVFMGEIYPNQPEHLYSNSTGEGFIFMDEYFEPIPESNEEILPPNAEKHAMN